MKKRLASIGAAAGILLGMTIIAYAVTSLFFMKSETSNLTKKTIFQFNLSTGLQETEVGPGDSVAVSPAVYNDATEPMYVFILVNQPTCNSEKLYTCTVSDSWKLVSDTEEQQVYAYAGDEMTVLMPGETTEALTENMTMESISNAEYYQISDINFSIDAYAIGTEDVSSNPAEAWEICRAIGNL